MAKAEAKEKKKKEREKEKKRKPAEDEAEDEEEAPPPPPATKAKAKEEKKLKEKKSKIKGKDEEAEEPKGEPEAQDEKQSKKRKKDKVEEKPKGKESKEVKDAKEKPSKAKKAKVEETPPKPPKVELQDEASEDEKQETRGGSSGSRAKVVEEVNGLVSPPRRGSRSRSRRQDRGRKSRKDSSGDDSSGSSERRARRRESAGLRAATGFQEPPLAPPPPVPAIDVTTLEHLPDKVKGLLENQLTLAQEVLRMKQAVEVVHSGGSLRMEPKEEAAETVLKLAPRLLESLLDPDNQPKLLARTGLSSASLNQEGLVVLKATTRKGLMKALAQLRRVAYHCQWGCTKEKVAALLSERPAKPVTSIVVRLAATSSRLQSHESRLSLKVRKLRIGTQAGVCQLVMEGVPGLSRKHCTITFEPDRGACYVQDLSTNGTYLNGKRLPRPPYKKVEDARVRLFHGDELFFRLRTDDMEELGYVVNLLELS